MELHEKLEAEARRLGCGWFGVAPAASLDKDLVALRAWLEAGQHGDMEWLARDPQRRCDPNQVVEGCRSVVVLGLNYLREALPADPAPPPPGMGRISKYARTRDYHRVLEKILKSLARYIDNELFPGATTRGYVDYGPVMERPWAARAGIGFVGKHTLLIHPAEGSFHFLAVLLTTADLQSSHPVQVDMPDCGDCRRCIDACPTGAITEPWKLDARRCLSYLTIEKEGTIDEEFWPQTAGYIFGCDICQDVCPYNRKRAVVRQEPSPLGAPLVPAAVPLA
ncbi:MAG: tRNA epoxyqueuosine(34) reductase QueG, partial [Candidatus Sumerlaeia bacterium]|nr:tRNA epoxyqueuosine(34) reductase QueG [Candidatus Sumerlaeia bacterium]